MQVWFINPTYTKHNASTRCSVMLNSVVKQPDREHELYGGLLFLSFATHSKVGRLAGLQPMSTVNCRGDTIQTLLKKRVKLVVDQRLLSLTMLPR